jgi:hypothetical protein
VAPVQSTGGSSSRRFRNLAHNTSLQKIQNPPKTLEIMNSEDLGKWVVLYQILLVLNLLVGVIGTWKIFVRRHMFPVQQRKAFLIIAEGICNMAFTTFMMSLYSSQEALNNMTCIVYLGYGGAAGYSVIVVACIRIWCVFVWYKLTESAVDHEKNVSGSFNFFLSNRTWFSTEAIAGGGVVVWLSSLIPLMVYFVDHPDQAASMVNSSECKVAIASLVVSSSFSAAVFLMIFVLYFVLRNVKENLSLVSEFKLILLIGILAAILPSLLSFESYETIMSNPEKLFLHQALSSWLIEILLQWVSLWRTSRLADTYAKDTKVKMEDEFKKNSTGCLKLSILTTRRV